MFFKRWKKQEDFNSKTESKLKAIDNSLDESFSNVKNDVSHVKQWITYLHQNQDKISSDVSEVQKNIDFTRQEIKYFVDQYYGYLNNMDQSLNTFKQQVSNTFTNVNSTQKDIFQRLQDLAEASENYITKSELDVQLSENKQALKEDILSTQPQSMQQVPQTVFDKLSELNTRIDELQKNKPNTTLKERVFKKVTRHSKEYVKSMLISMIKKYQKISALNLREMIVEEQGIVSKSSFYRLLNEIEQDESVNVVQEGKEKHYIWSLGAVPERR